MTVVERHDVAEREIIREEVRSELAHERRDKRLKSCGCAFLAFAVLIAAPIGVTVWMIARSGLAEIPVISTAVYKPPTPVRQVVPLVGTDADTILKSISAKVRPGTANGTAEIGLTEQELTTIIDAAVKSSGKMTLPLIGAITAAQAAISPDFIEFYLSGTQSNGKTTPILIRVKPVIMSGKLSFQVQEAVLGGMPLPTALIEPALNKAADAALSKAMGAAGGAVLNGIKLDQGHLTFIFSAR